MDRTPISDLVASTSTSLKRVRSACSSCCRKRTKNKSTKAYHGGVCIGIVGRLGQLATLWLTPTKRKKVQESRKYHISLTLFLDSHGVCQSFISVGNQGLFSIMPSGVPYETVRCLCVSPPDGACSPPSPSSRSKTRLSCARRRSAPVS